MIQRLRNKILGSDDFKSSIVSVVVLVMVLPSFFYFFSKKKSDVIAVVRSVHFEKWLLDYLMYEKKIFVSRFSSLVPDRTKLDNLIPLLFGGRDPGKISFEEGLLLTLRFSLFPFFVGSFYNIFFDYVSHLISSTSRESSFLEKSVGILPLFFFYDYQSLDSSQRGEFRLSPEKIEQMVHLRVISNFVDSIFTSFFSIPFINFCSGKSIYSCSTERLDIFFSDSVIDRLSSPGGKYYSDCSPAVLKEKYHSVVSSGGFKNPDLYSYVVFSLPVNRNISNVRGSKKGKNTSSSLEDNISEKELEDVAAFVRKNWSILLKGKSSSEKAQGPDNFSNDLTDKISSLLKKHFPNLFREGSGFRYFDLKVSSGRDQEKKSSLQHFDYIVSEIKKSGFSSTLHFFCEGCLYIACSYSVARGGQKTFDEVEYSLKKSIVSKGLSSDIRKNFYLYLSSSNKKFSHPAFREFLDLAFPGLVFKISFLSEKHLQNSPASSFVFDKISRGATRGSFFFSDLSPASPNKNSSFIDDHDDHINGISLYLITDLSSKKVQVDEYSIDGDDALYRKNRVEDFRLMNDRRLPTLLGAQYQQILSKSISDNSLRMESDQSFSEDASSVGDGFDI